MAGAAQGLSSSNSLLNVAALGVILRVAYELLTSQKQRDMLQTSAPVTVYLLVLYSAVAAGVAAGVSNVQQLGFADGVVQAEPWRIIGCLITYQRTEPLAAHLWLLLKIGPQVERRLGSRTFVWLFVFSGAVALCLREALATDHPSDARPFLLTPAPLFGIMYVWGQLASAGGGADDGAARPGSARLPWAMLGSIVLLEGLASAIPGLLGIGGGTLFQAIVGLPPPPPPKEAAASAAATDEKDAAAGTDPAPADAQPNAAAAHAGDTAAAGDAPPPPPAEQPKWVRWAQVLGVAYLILALSIDPDALSGNREAGTAQCNKFGAALDILDPTTSQLVSNFSATRLESTADVELAMRAYEWLASRWEPMAPAVLQQRLSDAAAVDPESTATAHRALYAAQLQREVKSVTDQWMPTLEINEAQEDREVLEVLLKQLGYPSNLPEEVTAAWLSGIATWRGARADDEKRIAALRLYVETGSLAGEEIAALPEAITSDGETLVNATLGQFDVPADMAHRTVLKELLKEMDMDIDEVADGANASLHAGVTLHLRHRARVSQERILAAAVELKAAMAPAMPRMATGSKPAEGTGRCAAPEDGCTTTLASGVLTAASRAHVERLVSKVLQLLPGTLTSDDDALHALLGALNLTDPTNHTEGSDVAASEEVTLPMLRLLRSSVQTHCAGLRRQAAREEAVASLQRLLTDGTATEDPVPPPDSEEDREEEESGASDTDSAPSKPSKPPPPPVSWDDDGVSLVGAVYGGYEEQAREMTSVEVLLDVLRMAQLSEDEIRKGDRARLEETVKAFHSDLRRDANRSVVVVEGDGGSSASRASAIRSEPPKASAGSAGWRPIKMGGWATAKVSQLLAAGGGDGSDFAMVIAALIHSLGGKVRIAIVCTSASSVAVEDPNGDGGGKACRLVTEARVGYHPDASARWVGERHAAGLGVLGGETPLLHFRRESDGPTWLSLAWSAPASVQGGSGVDGAAAAAAATEQGPHEQHAGAPYLPANVAPDAAEWTTFYPFDEHGCKWHVRGAEGDSKGRVHGSAPPRTVQAIAPDE